MPSNEELQHMLDIYYSNLEPIAFDAAECPETHWWEGWVFGIKRALHGESAVSDELDQNLRRDLTREYIDDGQPGWRASLRRAQGYKVGLEGRWRGPSDPVTCDNGADLPCYPPEWDWTHKGIGNWGGVDHP